MTTRYEVRFTLLHDPWFPSSIYGHAVEFRHLSNARDFRDAISGNIGNFIQGWCWEGLLVSVDGVFEITERRVP